MQPPFGYPFMYWVGLSPRLDEDAEALSHFDRFHRTRHVPEVLANNAGFVRAAQYKWVASHPCIDAAPDWLTVYELESEAAARAYLEATDVRGKARPRYSPGPPPFVSAAREWCMMWRRVGSAGATLKLPYAIHVADRDGLRNAAPRGIERVTTFELYRAFRHPESGCPTVCLVHELDEPATAALLQRCRSEATLEAVTDHSLTGPAHGVWSHVYRRVGPLRY